MKRASVLLAVLFCVAADEAPDAPAKNTTEGLKGTWGDPKVESGPKPPEGISVAVSLELAAGKGTWKQVSYGKKTAVGIELKFSYSVDTKKVPGEIGLVFEDHDLLPKGHTVRAIYTLDGDNLRIAYGEKDRLKEFPAKPAPGLWDLHLKRVKP